MNPRNILSNFWGSLHLHHPLFVPIRDGIMAQSRRRLVGQALQMPHWYGLCQLVLCLVHTLVDILVDKSFAEPHHQQAKHNLNDARHDAHRRIPADAS